MRPQAGSLADQQKDWNTLEIIELEEKRLSSIYEVIERSSHDRGRAIVLHDGRTRELEKQRLDAVGWREKNSLTEKLVEHGHHNPRKYLVEFEQKNSPYFGLIGIDDADKRFGQKSYLIGKQMLMDGNRVVIVDWRRAEISQLFYDFEEGEEYEATIQGVDREGVITLKTKVGIDRRTLHRIETSSELLELSEGEWRSKSGAVASSSETKSQQSDHRMVDIVSLISAQQFGMITKNSSGCTYLTGSAGTGKTTVALHRLSYLQFAQPELFRQERCLVLMFNRTLRDYVKKTSNDLLGATRVDTFSAWALTALKALGVTVITSFEDSFGARKKSSQLSRLLARYVGETRRMDPVVDLWKFYTQPYLQEVLFPEVREREAFRSEIQRKIESKDRIMSFSDVSILLRLCQLRRNPDSTVTGAFNYYDHIVVDEAQDFSQLELESILAASSVRRSLTVCADENQKILSFVDADGFTNFRGKLVSLGLDKETLSLSYRSAREIMELAARVSGRAVDASKAHSGVAAFHEVQSFAAATEKLRELLAELAAADPGALTAVICKKKADVRQIRAALGAFPALHGEEMITFEPGVLVVNTHQVKGLEFTNVVLWDPNDSDYRDNDLDRNLLYVAVTRACKRIDVIHWRALAKGLRGE
jgi:DNA helicase II / ATP-dependent DNA helicase PcrA